MRPSMKTDSAGTTRRNVAGACLLLLVALASGPAGAQGDDGAARTGAQGTRRLSKASLARAFKRPFLIVCKASAQKLCRTEVATGGDKPIARCLADKRVQLPRGCQSALRRARKVASFRRACGQDVQRLCAGARANGVRVLECLKQKPEEVSPSCQERLARRPGAKARADVAAVAGEVAAEELAGAPPIDQELASVPEEPAPEAPPAQETATEETPAEKTPAEETPAPESSAESAPAPER
jgi:hypothetical protein